jgi:hypothetical protein
LSGQLPYRRRWRSTPPAPFRQTKFPGSGTKIAHDKAHILVSSLPGVSRDPLGTGLTGKFFEFDWSISARLAGRDDVLSSEDTAVAVVVAIPVGAPVGSFACATFSAEFGAGQEGVEGVAAVDNRSVELERPCV